MFNLYQILTGAQGGQALDNLARQFGLSRDQADNAVKALIPALSTAFMTKAMHPGGLTEITGAMTDDQHKQAYADPGVAQDPSTQQKGGALAGSLFGNNAILQQVIQQAARYTGLPEATLQQMLPVIISIVLGGVATAMHNQGLGGILGQIAGSLGGSGAPGTPGQPPAGGGFGGGLGGMFGNILSSMLGGAQSASPHQPVPHPTEPPPANPSAPSGMPGTPPAWQAGMEALSKMFQPGVHPHPGQPGAQDDLAAQISSILGGKR